MNSTSAHQLVAHPKFGFLQITPTPSAEDITRFYANEFYSGDYKNFNDSSLEVQLENREFHEGTWEDMVFHIKNILEKPLESISLLDIGCGWAQALLYFAGKGIKCHGFDPALEAVAYGVSKGLDLRHADMERMDVFQGQLFDVVMLNNVLEHLSNPVDVVREIHNRVLVQGGLLIIDVPNEFNDFQLAGRNLHNLPDWWIAPPAHLNYFSKDTLQSLLEGCGYRVVLAESSFPLEMFLLFGDCYVGNGKLGRECHLKRVAFEENLRKLGFGQKLREFYQALAQLNLGRQIKMYAVAK
jgi:SAM-dependent methyltransferase